MNNEFCPDCGHLLSSRVTQCAFCGWAVRIDHLAYKGFDPDKEDDLIYALADEVYPGLGICG